MNDSIPILCELLFKSFAVLALAIAIHAAWRRASAATRHLIWMLGFVSLLAVPLTRMAAPVWTVELSQTKAAAPARALEPVAVIPVPGSASVAAMPSPGWKLPSWGALLTSAWLAGILVSLGYRVAGELRLRRLRRESRVVSDPQVRALADAIAAEYGMAVPPEVRSSRATPVPLTWGVWRPVVLLPQAAHGWPAKRLAAALRHEFAHVRRHDCLSRILAHVACAVYWPNPVVWLVARRLHLAQEQACDDLVLRGGASPSEYADLLVQTVRSLLEKRRSSPYALAMAQPSILEARVRAIVENGRNRAPLAPGAAALGGATVALLLVASALAQVGADAPAEGPQILIESRFVELSDDALKQVGSDWLGAPPQPGVCGVVNGQQVETVLKRLGEINGVDVLSTPRVTTLPKQRAEIHVGTDFVYPTAWENDKEPGTWKPKSFEKKSLGVTLRAEAGILADGKLDLALEPEVVELLGFSDLDDAGTTLPPAQSQTPEGHRISPLFSTRKVKTQVTVRPGETVVLGGLGAEKVQILEETEAGKAPVRVTRQVKSHLFVFVTAKIIKPSKVEEPVTITSSSLTYDTSSGKGTATGNVRIETPQMVIEADKVTIAQKQNATPVPDGAAQSAAKIVIPRLELQEAALGDALEFLRRAGGAQKSPVNIVVLPDAARDAKITLSLREIPLSEALRYVAELSGNELAWTAEAGIIRRKGSIGEQIRTANIPATPVVQRAERIVVPSIDFEAAPLPAVVEFLVAKSRELDPEHRGVNLILIQGSQSAPAITLSLRNIPLMEAIRYVAQVSGTELAADEQGLVLRQKAAK